MGGCRCTFRECTNNTVNSPGKHFFHFPYKDSERCKKWALSSDKISFLQLPWTQLRNKTICEDHFMDTCFMNFKRERLVKTAIPTLDRTKAGGVIDIKLDESRLKTLEYCFMDKGSNQQIIDLPDTQQQQQRQRPQSLPEQKRVIHVNLSVNENLSADADDDDILDAYVVSESDPLDVASGQQTQAVPEKRMIPVDSKPLVLNRICPKRVKRIEIRKATGPQTAEKVTILPKQIGIINDEIETTCIPNKRIKSEFGGRKVLTQPGTGRSYGNPLTVAAKNEITETPSLEIEPTDNSFNDTITANILEKINHIEERDANKVDKSLYMRMMEEHAKQIEDLKKLLTDKLTDKKGDANSDDQAMASDVAAHASAGTRLIRVEKGPAMTKVQLFNGIRKYLNPTMVALLRMEMFGSAEREYRPDERQLSKELYNLNQSVYDYMRDEWRFRLPAKTEVEKWLKDSDDNDETWELC